MLSATASAYGFARFRFRFQDQLMVLLLVAQMFPGVATYIPLYQALRGIGLYNTHPGLIILFVGFVTLLIGTFIVMIEDDITVPIFHYSFYRGNFYLGYKLAMNIAGSCQRGYGDTRSQAE